MAKVSKAKKSVSDVALRLSRITDDQRTSIFHSLNIGAKDLDEYTIGVIRERLSRYLSSWVLPELDNTLEYLEK